MIKNIVFDMGNVLVKYDPENVLREYLDENDVQQIMLEFYGAGAINDTDRGIKTHAQAIDERSRFLTKKQTDTLKMLYVDNIYGCYHQPEYDDMYTLVCRLKENGYKIYLLSNAGTDWYIYSKQMRSISLMDGTVISSDYKLLKPEKDLYQVLLNKYDLNADECVFIDDNPCNVEGAENVGIHGIRFSAKDDDRADLIENLRDVGVNI